MWNWRRMKDVGYERGSSRLCQEDTDEEEHEEIVIETDIHREELFSFLSTFHYTDTHK